MVIFKNYDRHQQALEKEEFRFVDKLPKKGKKKELEKISINTITFFGQNKWPAWDMIVELNNGKKSEKLGCKKNFKQHSVLQMKSKTTVVRVKEINSGIYGISLFNEDWEENQGVSFSSGGAEKNYQLEEGEVVIGVFGTTVARQNNNHFYELGLILAQM